MKKYDLIIIGGGAAGMMAAYAAKKENANKTVLILEKNEKLGKKIYITGNGDITANITAIGKNHKRILQIVICQTVGQPRRN